MFGKIKTHYITARIGTECNMENTFEKSENELRRRCKKKRNRNFRTWTKLKEILVMNFEIAGSWRIGCETK